MRADGGLSSEVAADCHEFTTQIVSAYCSNNQLSPDELPGLMGDVHRALAGLRPGEAVSEAAGLVPAVPIKRSVFPDYIVCLEDGKKLKMLKRHLQASYGMTPQAYRERWKLPSSYPMVAPNYSERRSAMSKQIGLGRKVAVEEVA